MKKKGKKL